LPSGYVLFMKESVARVVEVEAADGVMASDIIFANI